MDLNDSMIEQDLNDQSYQTSLRTEIYTSEDEHEINHYYSYLPTLKKERVHAIPAPLCKGKTFKSCSKSELDVQEGPNQK